MIRKKIAVFTTSEIQELNSHNVFVDTGALQAALEQGYEVFVVSTREKFGPHDKWWRELVPADHVTHCRPLQEGESDSMLRLNEPWKALYERLGHEYPHNFYQGRDCGEAFWTGARFKLVELGYRLGNSFRMRRTTSVRPPPPQQQARRPNRGTDQRGRRPHSRHS